MSLARLVPVLSSTASLTLALSEYQALIPWRSSDLPPKHFSAWFDRWFKLVLAGVLVFGITSTYSGYAAYNATLGPARTMYKYGTCFALAHFVFAPPVAQCINRLVHGPTHPKDELDLWLKIHTLRTLTTDLPALFCFVSAFLYT
ncbi:hypothetical protein OG21DRAFT_1508015 [Imleria badia]|nr:hypothetical protein OG21DRAFT_1508015 [Imleria badia]